MNIGIIGTNGFLSTAIAKYAIQQGWQLNMFGLIPPTDHKCNRFYQVNLMSDDFDCAALLDSDLVVYAVGAGIQSNLKESAEMIYSLNVTTPVNVCNKLKELKYQGGLVTFGSVFEMGEVHDERLFTEKDILSSIAPAPSDYVVSKRMLTRFVDSYKHEFVHWHFIIPTIYGQGENPKRLIPYTIHAILNGEQLHYTAGNQVRQYVHVSEVPQILDMAYSKGLPSGIYNIEGKETISVRDLVTKIHELLGKDLPDDCFGTEKRADVGMKYLALNGEKLHNAIGYSAKVCISDAVMSYI